jgi:hypothetical protein
LIAFDTFSFIIFDSELAKSLGDALACCCVMVLFDAILPLTAKIIKTVNTPKSKALTLVFFGNFTNAKISANMILVIPW